MKWPALLAGVGCLTLAATLAAQGTSSLSDLDIEFTEAKLTLEMATAENQALRKRLVLLEENVRSLTESLAVANSEAELFRRQYTDLKLRMEALGLESVGTDKSKIEQRLLKAVRDLQILEREKEHLSEQLVQFSEAVLRFLQNTVSVDPQGRAELEAQLRSVAEVLGFTPGVQQAKPFQATITDALVISVKEELGLVVINVGSRAGVKLGMPFRVSREGTVIGTVQVVNVRDGIAGAVIQDLSSTKTKIKVGDRLRVDAR